MKKYMEKVLFALLIVGAAEVHAAYTVGPVDITYLRTYDHYVVLSIDPAGTNQDGCTRSSASNFIYLDMKEDRGKPMYAAALTAFMAGYKIKVSLNGCGKWGSTTIPKTYRIDVYKP